MVVTYGSFEANSLAQTLFLASPAWETFFGGGPGCGKTECLTVKPMPYMNHPKYLGYTFRRNEDDLTELIRFARQYYPAIGGRESESGRQWAFPQGGQHILSHMNLEGDWTVVQGKNVNQLNFDELAHFTPLQYSLSKAWCRSAAPDLPAQVNSTGNPIGNYVGFVKALFFDVCRPFEVTKVYDERGTYTTRLFIPSSYRDNPHLLAANPDYEARLLQIPDPYIRRALTTPNILDAWRIVVGQFFHFVNLVHVVPASQWPDFTRQRIVRIRTLDYGGKAATVCLWLVQDAHGAVWVEQEYYVDDEPLSVHVPAILRKSTAPVEISVIDPSAREVKHRYVAYTDKSLRDVIAALAEQALAEWTGPIPVGAQDGLYCQFAEDDHEAGYEQLHQRLHYTETIAPTLRIHESCTRLIGDLAQAQGDPAKPNEIKNHTTYHGIAALRYGLMHLRLPAMPTKAPVPRESWQAEFERLRTDRLPVASRWARRVA